MTTFTYSKEVEVKRENPPVYDTEGQAQDYFEEYNGEGSYAETRKALKVPPLGPTHLCSSLGEFLTIVEQKRDLDPLAADDPFQRRIGVSFSDGSSYELPLKVLMEEIALPGVQEILARLGGSNDSFRTPESRHTLYSGKIQNHVTQTMTELHDFSKSPDQPLKGLIQVLPPNPVKVVDLEIPRPEVEVIQTKASSQKPSADNLFESEFDVGFGDSFEDDFED